MAKAKSGQKRRLQEILSEVQGGKCAYCSTRLGAKMGAKLTLDHVFPHSLGYRNASNVLGSCKRCNFAKGVRMPNGCEIILLMGVNAKRGIALLPERA